MIFFTFNLIYLFKISPSLPSLPPPLSGTRICAMLHVWRSEDNLCELVLTFHHVYGRIPPAFLCHCTEYSHLQAFADFILLSPPPILPYEYRYESSCHSFRPFNPPPPPRAWNLGHQAYVASVFTGSIL